MKIVINDCHGGFGLSDEGIEHYAKLADIELTKEVTPQIWGSTYYLPDGSRFHYRDIARDDPMLVQTVETLGENANDSVLANLKVVEIPNDVKWQIDEYDGLEWVSEQHRTWS